MNLNFTMYPLKRILVCLDMTDTDDILIRYAAMFGKTVQCEKLYFIHCVKSLELPEQLRKEFPEMAIPLDETITQQLQENISRHIDPNDMSYDIGVKDGNTTENILKWANIKHVDLIVMGRKPSELGTGVNANRIANVSPCSVLMIPQETKMTLNKIFVPIDFSPYSHRAILRALTIKEKNDTKIVLQNVYHVPSGYHTTGKKYEEFAEIMNDNAHKSYERFLKKNKLNEANFKFITTLDGDNHPGDRIATEAQQNGADLIMIGSRGRTTAASLLLGSIAVALLKYNYSIPCFIVKNKNENMGFFQALMKL